MPVPTTTLTYYASNGALIGYGKVQGQLSTQKWLGRTRPAWLRDLELTVAIDPLGRVRTC